jgi:hypothetical protein
VISIIDLEYLFARGVLRPGMRLLDIGSQNLLHLEPKRASDLIAKLGGDPAKHTAQIEAICARSIIDGVTRTTYLSEFIELTSVSYESYDVAPGHKTTVFDLNFDSVPRQKCENFDIILNNGTTEHVINQYNAMKVVHDALAVDGVAVHYVPSTGYSGHGYVCYHEEFFTDLAKANGYTVEDLWYCRTGSCWFDSAEHDFRNPMDPHTPNGGQPPEVQRMVPTSNIYIALRKKVSAPFRVQLELATSHSSADQGVTSRYEAQNPARSLLRRIASRF